MLGNSSLIKQEPITTVIDDNNDRFPSFIDQYQSNLDAFVTSVDNLSTIRPSAIKNRRVVSPLKSPRHLKSNSSSLVTFDRDPAATEITDHVTDELRWLLIQYGPHQPRDAEYHFPASAVSTNNGKGTMRFRSKWFDDVRFSDWLEYSLATGRAYCFYCRLFAESNRNRAFSRDGIKNWRKCLGSRGQKKRRSTGIPIKSDEDSIICQRRGLLESHAMSEGHKQSYQKYLKFVNHMRFETQPIESKQADNSISGTNFLKPIEQDK